MQLLGHDGPPTNWWTENLITGAELTRCPVRTLQLAHDTDPSLAREVDRYVDLLYPLHKRSNAMLVDGGIADQPARYLAIISAVESMEIAVEAKALELSRKEDE